MVKVLSLVALVVGMFLLTSEADACHRGRRGCSSCSAGGCQQSGGCASGCTNGSCTDGGCANGKCRESTSAGWQWHEGYQCHYYWQNGKAIACYANAQVYDLVSGAWSARGSPGGNTALVAK